MRVMTIVSGLIQENPKTLLLLPASLAAFGANFRLLRKIGRRFEEETGGHEPFDFQGFGLTVAGVHAQLPLYTVESRTLYRRFFLSDITLPFLGSIGQSLALAALLGTNSAPLSRRLRNSGAPFAAFVPTLFDWAENVGFLYVIERYSRKSKTATRVAVLSHKLKLLSLFFTSGSIGALLALNILAWLGRRLR